MHILMKLGLGVALVVATCYAAPQRYDHLAQELQEILNGMNVNKRDEGDGCPCVHGECNFAEDPYGWGWYCICDRGAGGFYCQFENACDQFPCNNGQRCMPIAANNSTGRLCFTPWRINNDV